MCNVTFILNSNDVKSLFKIFNNIAGVIFLISHPMAASCV